jgi:hypothetical protein
MPMKVKKDKRQVYQRITGLSTLYSIEESLSNDLVRLGIDSDSFSELIILEAFEVKVLIIDLY